MWTPATISWDCNPDTPLHLFLSDAMPAALRLRTSTAEQGLTHFISSPIANPYVRTQ
jgi:hypothetical protein